ncbi:MAG: Fmu (Sun) domain-containing protein, partial [Bacteroidetes bacterium]|nr:Fmu (Sun) domain-containing protein [Bacteroidota bacterium]
MSRFYSYINSTKEILTAYSGNEPFASFVKKYFALHKKYGSKDRKQISHLCYCYFRLGAAGKDLPDDERILIALYLCSDKTNEILEAIKPGWNDNVSLSLNEKLSIIDLPIEISKVFFWKDELSEGIDYEKFNRSFFIQPDLFLRLRPGNEKKVKRKLTDAGISFQEINQTCLSLSNATKLDEVIETD